MATEDYDNAQLVAEDGTGLGHVERSFVDESGNVRLVETKIGTLFAKHRLVPVHDANLDGDTLTVPYSHDEVEGSPDAKSVGDTIEGDLFEQVRLYYDRLSGSAQTEQAADEQPQPTAAEAAAVPVHEGPDDDMDATQEMNAAPAPTTLNNQAATGNDAEFGQIIDRGDVIEIPIVEEQLVKQPVVTEVLRVRKKDVVQVENVEGDVRREDVDVEQTGDANVRGDASTSSR